ncbi:MAG: hypothetical protein LBT08_01780 [Synergistaceae bacterium]|nr:hypothetical protein [Synergistaceae bacterium]
MAGKLISAVILSIIFNVSIVQIPVQAFPFTTVYITHPRRMYHRHNCIFVRTNKKAISLSNAKKLGYWPCARCNPPRW